MRKFSKEELSWGLYDWGNSAYSMTITSTILPIYFKLVSEGGGMSPSTSTAYWGYTISISTLVVSLLAPVLGIIADYKDNKKKLFKVFVFIGIVATILLALVPSNQPNLLLINYGFTVLGFSGANIFYDSFLVDVTDESRMDKVSSMGFALGYIGSTIPFIISIAIVILVQGGIIGISIASACKIAFLITALWWGSFTIPLLKNVNQKYYIEKETKPVLNSFRRLFNTIKEIKSHKVIFTFLGAYFFYIDGVDTIIGMATSYGTDLGISMTSLLLILLLTQFIAFPFTIIFGRISEKIGSKKMILMGIGIYSLICIYGYFLKTTFDFWVLAMSVGAVQGGIQSISRSYFAKLVPKKNSNEFFGFYNIFGKFAAIIGPFLVAFFTQITGESRNGIVSLLILFILGGIFLSRVKESN